MVLEPLVNICNVFMFETILSSTAMNFLRHLYTKLCYSDKKRFPGKQNTNQKKYNVYIIQIKDFSTLVCDVN